MNNRTWLQAYGKALAGKTAAVTGGTGGLGVPLCRGILELGGSLVLVVRNRQKGEALGDRLRQEFPGAQIRCLTAELSDMDSVRALAVQLDALEPDLLIHNAGVYQVPRKTCSSGFDNIFQINFLTPYFLTRTLLPGLSRRGGKVVAIGSVAHRYSVTDPEDFDFSGRKSCALAYGNSKRCLMYALWQLFAAETGASLAIAHPGVTVTNMTAHFPKALYALIKWPMKVIFPRPDRAVRCLWKAILEPVPLEHWEGPGIFGVWGAPKIESVTSARPGEQQAVFDRAEQIFQALAREH